LEQISKTWNYLIEIESKAKSEGKPNDELKNWLKWARNVADSIDPISDNVSSMVERYSYKS